MATSPTGRAPEGAEKGPGVPATASLWGADGASAAGGLSGDVMAKPCLLEHPGDDLFQRRVFHAHISELVTVKDRS